jgi:7,8-dihydropterin-6-yl-methyl-4-(beta-D-ribofuranosyl)aminobenzene 5'-phosphate synthase
MRWWVACAWPGPNEPLIPQTVEAMRGFELKVAAAGHCTGWRARTALANALGEAVISPSAVGKRYESYS